MPPDMAITPAPEPAEMRVLVLERNGSGGIAQYTHALCGSLAAQGPAVRLVTPKRESLPDFGSPFEVAEVLAANVGHSRRKAVALEALNAARVFVEVARWRPDVVLVEAPEPGRLDEAWVRGARARGSRIVWGAHQIAARDWGEQLAPWARRLYGQVDGMITFSEAERERLARNMPDLARNTAVIPLGTFRFLVDDLADRHASRERLGLPPDVPVILMFGFLKPYKGIDTFMDAMELVDSRGVDVIAYVAGQPVSIEQGEELRRRVAEAGLGDRVVLRLGFLDNTELPELFAAADVTVLPYRVASQSAVTQVSYAHGRPVIVSDVGGLPEDVDEGVTGTVAPADDPVGLADAISRMVEDPAALQRMTRALEEGVPERFSWDRVAKAHIAYFEKVLTRPPP